MPHVPEPVFRFCPRCGGRLVARQLKNGDPERLVCTSCQQVLYLDPKVAVGTIIRDAAGRVVLVQRAIEPGYGRWVFPGGYVDRGEPLEVAALREAREECGLEVRLDGLINLYSYPGRTPIIIVYAATLLQGTLCTDDESLDARWFDREEIPWTLLAFPSTRHALTDYFSGRLYPVHGQARSWAT
jgi:ADP-ribose pyrophosphatase YjhB (NUDIX family)